MASQVMALTGLAALLAAAGAVQAQPAPTAPWNARHAPPPSASRADIHPAGKTKRSDEMHTGAGSAEPTGPYTSTEAPRSDLTGEDGAAALAPYAAPPPGVAPPGGAPDTSTPPAASASPG